VSDTRADELTERAAEYLDRIVGGGETTPATCEAMEHPADEHGRRPANLAPRR
jgi:hypothetical protein